MFRIGNWSICLVVIHTHRLICIYGMSLYHKVHEKSKILYNIISISHFIDILISFWVHYRASIIFMMNICYFIKTQAYFCSATWIVKIIVLLSYVFFLWIMHCKTLNEWTINHVGLQTRKKLGICSFQCVCNFSNDQK